jgi:hypothetical protein
MTPLNSAHIRPYTRGDMRPPNKTSLQGLCTLADMSVLLHASGTGTSRRLMSVPALLLLSRAYATGPSPGRADANAASSSNRPPRSSLHRPRHTNPSSWNMNWHAAQWQFCSCWSIDPGGAARVHVLPVRANARARARSEPARTVRGSTSPLALSSVQAGLRGQRV